MSQLCNNCIAITNNEMKYRLKMEKRNDQLNKDCLFFPLPAKSCRELMAFSLLEAENLRYLEYAVANKKNIFGLND